MSKKNVLLIIFLTITIALIASVKVSFAEAAMLQIGDENMWIIVTARGTSGKVEVPIIITDPQGRRIGFDPRTEIWLTEVPASYESFRQGPVDTTEEIEHLYLTDPKFREEFEAGTDYITEATFNLIAGDYLIEAIGKGLTEYNLTAVVTRRIKGQPTKSSKINFGGVIDKNLASKFKITYNPDPSAKPGVGARVSTPSSLKQDITLARKVKGIWERVGEAPKLDYLINNDGIMNSLLKKVEAVGASIERGQKKTARNQLNAFVNEVNAQKGKHISDKAVKMLLEDAQYLIGRL